MRPFIGLSTWSFALAIWVACVAPPLQAGEISGVKFADNAEVSGQALLLNGLGIRYRAIFKVYAAGLYLPKKSHDDKEVLTMAGAKRIHAVMFRELEGDVLGRLMIQGIRENSSSQEALRHAGSIGKLGQAFSERKKLLPGDTFTIDFDPIAGPQVKINGKALASQPTDPAFNQLFLRIWLGDSPADHQLKKGMLNQSIDNKQPY
jgi:Chalcone isomerase-like